MQQITCASCKDTFEATPEVVLTRPYGAGFSEVGVMCGNCDHFTRAYFTNAELEKRRKKLERFRRNARKSTHHYQKYQQAKRRFQRLHDQVQELAVGTSPSRP